MRFVLINVLFVLVLVILAIVIISVLVGLYEMSQWEFTIVGLALIAAIFIGWRGL